MTDLEFPSASPDDLDIAIGRSLLVDELGSKDVSDHEAREVGLRWFTARLDTFREVVCAHPLVRSQLLLKSAQKRNELFAAVVDALMAWKGYGRIPVTTLGARLVHYGVQNLCPGCDGDAD